MFNLKSVVIFNNFQNNHIKIREWTRRWPLIIIFQLRQSTPFYACQSFCSFDCNWVEHMLWKSLFKWCRVFFSCPCFSNYVADMRVYECYITSHWLPFGPWDLGGSIWSLPSVGLGQPVPSVQVLALIDSTPNDTFKQCVSLRSWTFLASLGLTFGVIVFHADSARDCRVVFSTNLFW